LERAAVFRNGVTAARGRRLGKARAAARFDEGCDPRSTCYFQAFLRVDRSANQGFAEMVDVCADTLAD
jgi:hypothetical protein